MANKLIAINMHEEGSKPTLQFNSDAAVASHLVSAVGGVLLYLTATNLSAAVAYLQIFDAKALPADGTVPLLTYKVGVGESFNLVPPVCCGDGIFIAASSTAGTLTHDAGTPAVEPAPAVPPTLTFALFGLARV